MFIGETQHAVEGGFGLEVSIKEAGGGVVLVEEIVIHESKDYPQIFLTY